MQSLDSIVRVPPVNFPGAVRDAGKIKSRVIGILLERELLNHFLLQQTDSGHIRELLSKIAEWFIGASIIRSNKGSINLLIQQWVGQTGGTNEAPGDTEEIYISMGISYYLTRDWEIVRELNCIGIAVDVFDGFLKYFDTPIPGDIDRLKSTHHSHKELSSILEEILNASSRQNLTAAVSLMSLVFEKKDNEAICRFVHSGKAVRTMTSYVDHISALLSFPMTSFEVPGYAADWSQDLGSPSSMLKEYFDKSSYLKPSSGLKEFEQAILVIGEFPEANLSTVSLCLFDLKPSRSSVQDRPLEIIDQHSLRFKPLLDQLEAVDSVPFTVLELEESLQATPHLLEPPKHIGRGFRLDKENIKIPGLVETVHGNPDITVSIILTRWINRVRAQGLTTNTGSATSPQPTAIEPFTAADGQLIHTPGDVVIYESISCMPHYLGWSFEELRLADYQIGVRRTSKLPTARSLQANPTEGTLAVPFAAVEASLQNPRELPGAQGITAVPYYRSYSYEELRVADYAQGRRWEAKK